jgi:hypothetical protein
MTRLICLYAVALGTLLAQPNPANLFPEQAEVFVDSYGLARLELPNEVLTRVAADLSDLRLFGAQGNEVPYAIESGQSFVDAQNEFSPSVTALDRSTDEPERGQSTYRETYRLELPEYVSLAGQWTLAAFHTSGLPANGLRAVPRAIPQRQAQAPAPVADGEVRRPRGGAQYLLRRPQKLATPHST